MNSLGPYIVRIIIIYSTISVAQILCLVSFHYIHCIETICSVSQHYIRRRDLIFVQVIHTYSLSLISQLFSGSIFSASSISFIAVQRQSLLYLLWRLYTQPVSTISTVEVIYLTSVHYIYRVGTIYSLYSQYPLRLHPVCLNNIQCVETLFTIYRYIYGVGTIASPSPLYLLCMDLSPLCTVFCLDMLSSQFPIYPLCNDYIQTVLTLSTVYKLDLVSNLYWPCLIE